MSGIIGVHLVCVKMSGCEVLSDTSARHGAPDDADLKRARTRQEMQVEHQATSAVRAATRRAQAQLLQARQVMQQMCKGGTHSYPPCLQVKPMVHI